MATLKENVARTKADFKAIKDELVSKGASISSETPTSKYANIIKEMSTLSSEEAYEQGRQDVISKSKYIPKTATGKVISLTDVSEVYHKVKVYGDGQEVEVYGKNLLNEKSVSPIAVNAEGVTRYGWDLGVLPQGNYVLTAYGNYDLSKAISYKTITNGVYSDYVSLTGTAKSKTIAVDGTQGLIVYLFQGETNLPDDVTLQLEVGAISSSYEEYKGYKTITATPTGTEIDSMCPNMNFIADSDITVDYYSSFGMAEKELAMWNALTNFGAKSDWRLSFSHTNFSGYTIPTGLCRPTTAIGNMFAQYRGNELPRGVDCSDFDATKTDLTYHCYYTFASSTSLKHIYDMGIPAVKSYDRAYYNCTSLVRIEIIRSDENSAFSVNCFNNCPKLTHVIFSGTIASDINLQWSPLLDDESLISLGMSLFPASDDGTEYTRTITLSDASKSRLQEIYVRRPDWNDEDEETQVPITLYELIVEWKCWIIA